jgi:hypothetical protein
VPTRPMSTSEPDRLCVSRFLTATQASAIDADRDVEPGKILREMARQRYGAARRGLLLRITTALL